MAARPNSAKLVLVSEVASLFGYSEDAVMEMMEGHSTRVHQAFFSIGELARRWRCSRGTVYNRLRAAGTRVLDFSAPGKKGKKVVAAKVVLQIESRKTKRLA